jgi:hypothetical protein
MDAQSVTAAASAVLAVVAVVSLWLAIRPASDR